MNAKKLFSAIALTAGSVALIAAAAPTTATPTLVERLNQIEQQGTSKDSGLNPKANRPEFLQTLDDRGTSKETGINLKANRPEFLQQLDGQATGKDSGIDLKSSRRAFLEALNEQATSPSDLRARL